MEGLAKVSSVFRRSLFNGRSAIVTGGATGIGKAITQELLHLGCKVMIASRNADRLKAAATELQKQLPEGSTAELEYTVCNIRQEEQVKKLVVINKIKRCPIDSIESKFRFSVQRSRRPATAPWNPAL